MPQYSVIQYVPDTVRGEVVNVGVVALDGKHLACYFAENLKRVRLLGGDVGFVKDFAAQLPRMSASAVRAIVETWDESIRFTPLRGAILDVDTLIVDAARRFLVDPPESERGAQTRTNLIKNAKAALGTALSNRLGRAARRLVKPTFELQGKLEKHKFDLTIGNGVPLFAVDALSFQIPHRRKLEESVNAVKWAVDDMRGKGIEIAIAVLPPPESEIDGASDELPYADRGTLYQASADIFQQLGAKVIDPPRFGEWAEHVADEVGCHFPGGQALI